MCWVTQMSHFHPIFPSLLLTFIPIHHSINHSLYHFHKRNMGLPCYFPIYLFLSILREFMIKYWKIDIFSFISQSCMSFVMCRNILRFSTNGLYKIFIDISSTFSRFGDNYSKKENHERICEDLKG